MSEKSICHAKASVMVYNNEIKKWEHAGGSQGISKVHVYNNTSKHSYRIVGRKVTDNEVVINCVIVKNLKYNKATATFHQWRDQRQVYGLNFQSAEDAKNFSETVANAIVYLNNPPESDCAVAQIVGTNDTPAAPVPQASDHHQAPPPAAQPQSAPAAPAAPAAPTPPAGPPPSSEPPPSAGPPPAAGGGPPPPPPPPTGGSAAPPAAAPPATGGGPPPPPGGPPPPPAGPPPPPMGGAPPPPAGGGPPPPAAPSGGGGGGLLGAIAGGVQLKKRTEDAPKPASGGGGGGNLLDEIAGGIKLKKRSERVEDPKPSGGGGGGGGNLLDEIAAGFKLKKKSEDPPKPASGGGGGGGGGGNLLDEIAGGIKLKKRSERVEEPKPAPADDGGGGGMMAALQKRLAARQKKSEPSLNTGPTNSKPAESAASTPTPSPVVQNKFTIPKTSAPEAKKSTPAYNRFGKQESTDSGASAKQLDTLKADILEAVKTEINKAKEDIIKAFKEEIAKMQEGQDDESEENDN